MENLQLEEEEDIDPSHPFAPLIQAKRKLREESGDFSEDPLMGLLDCERFVLSLCLVSFVD